MKSEWYDHLDAQRSCSGCGATGVHADLTSCNACDNHVCGECQTELQMALGVCSDECAAEEAKWLVRRVDQLRKQLRAAGRTA